MSGMAGWQILIAVMIVFLLVALILGLTFGMNSSNLKVVKGPNANKLALFITDSSVGQFVGANGFVFVDGNGLPTAKKVNLSESTDVEGVLQSAQIPLFTGDVTNTISKTQLDLGANTVDTAQLKANSVTTDKIADGAVTDAKTNFTNKPPVRLVSTTAENPTTSNLADGRKIDGVTVLTKDLVLLTAEAGAPPSINNGPWVAGVPEGSWPNSRPPWFPTGGTASNGDTIFVLQGTTEAGSHWYISSPSGSFTIGTTAMSWTKVANTPPFTFAAPVTITGDNANALQVKSSAAPVFNVNTLGPAQTGLEITGQTATNGVLLTVTSTGTDESLFLSAKNAGEVVVDGSNMVVISDSATAFTVAKSVKTSPSLQVSTVGGVGTASSGLLIVSQDTSIANTGVLLKTTAGTGFANQSLKLDAAGTGSVELNTLSGTGAVISGQNIEFKPVADRSLSFGTTLNATPFKLSVIGLPTTAGAGGAVEILGGAGNSAVALTTGGAVNITAGGAKAGGKVTISAGTPTAGAGGDVNITATSAVGSGVGGAMLVQTGSGVGAGGNFTVTTGGSSGSNGGNIGFTAGTTSAGAGGNFTVASGDGTTLGGIVQLEAGDAATGGPVTIKSGNGSSGAGGTFTLQAGTGTVAGGPINVLSGAATAAAAPGGAITVTAGDGLTTGSGGAVNIKAGSTGVGGTGGSVNIDIGTGTVAKGSILIGQNGITPTVSFVNQLASVKKVLDVPGALKTLVEAESGYTINLTITTGAATINLPPVGTPGLHYKFLNTVARTGICEIKATALTPMVGALNNSAGDAAVTAKTTGGTVSITFTATALLGDWVEVLSNGTSWFSSGQSRAAAGLAFV